VHSVGPAGGPGLNPVCDGSLFTGSTGSSVGRRPVEPRQRPAARPPWPGRRAGARSRRTPARVTRERRGATFSRQGGSSRRTGRGCTRLAAPACAGRGPRLRERRPAKGSAASSAGRPKILGNGLLSRGGTAWGCRVGPASMTTAELLEEVVRSIRALGALEWPHRGGCEFTHAPPQPTAPEAWTTSSRTSSWRAARLDVEPRTSGDALQEATRPIPRLPSPDVPPSPKLRNARHCHDSAQLFSAASRHRRGRRPRKAAPGPSKTREPGQTGRRRATPRPCPPRRA